MKLLLPPCTIVVALALLAMLACQSAALPSKDIAAARPSNSLGSTPQPPNASVPDLLSDVRHGNTTALRIAPTNFMWYRNMRPIFQLLMMKVGTGRCLDVEQSRKTNMYTDAQMWRCTAQDEAQRFHFMAPFGVYDWFYISSWDFRYCLDVAEGIFRNSQPVRWWDCNLSAAQRWRRDGPWGHVTPLDRHDLCLDPVGGIAGSYDGQGMQLWSCVYGEQGHVWRLLDFLP